jgi:hypothetical protein
MRHTLAVLIYKILLPPEWSVFEATGTFTGSDFDHASGFVHCSSGEQLATTAGPLGTILRRRDIPSCVWPNLLQCGRSSPPFPRRVLRRPIVGDVRGGRSGSITSEAIATCSQVGMTKLASGVHYGHGSNITERRLESDE